MQLENMATDRHSSSIGAGAGAVAGASSPFSMRAGVSIAGHSATPAHSGGGGGGSGSGGVGGRLDSSSGVRCSFLNHIGMHAHTHTHTCTRTRTQSMLMDAIGSHMHMLGLESSTHTRCPLSHCSGLRRLTVAEQHNHLVPSQSNGWIESQVLTLNSAS
jgi:hypothetical protein